LKVSAYTESILIKMFNLQQKYASRDTVPLTGPSGQLKSAWEWYQSKALVLDIHYLIFSSSIYFWSL